MTRRLTVVGIGAEGWDGLTPAARTAIGRAQVVLGSRRQLCLVPKTEAVFEPLPSPLRAGLGDILERHRGRSVVVLASGDPLVSGIGTTLIELVGAAAVTIIPNVSSVALARARMAWSAEEVDIVSLVGRNTDLLRRYISAGRRLIALSADGRTPAVIAAITVEEGYPDARVTVLSNLGSADEGAVSSTAGEWGADPSPSLNVVCIECGAGPPRSTLPGLPDRVYDHDGQITKRQVRAAAVCALAPQPGEVLWDVGAGSGSVGIEWSRSDPRCRAIAIERDPDRAKIVERNSRKLGVPTLEIVIGSAPDVLPGLRTPDAVFVGGGASKPGVLEACWAALPNGGRLVAHAVTLETERVLVDWWRRYNGELDRLSIESASPIGSFNGWQPQRSVTQLSLSKGSR